MALISRSHRPPALIGCLCHLPLPTLAASRGSSRCRQCVALTASALTLTSPSPGPPAIVATPPAVLPLYGVVQTFAAQLTARPRNPLLIG
jgi:hypothetical protein